MGGDEKEKEDVIRRQQKLLHQLYTELEAEREASATAASEALSMILRLQREKASERLEASQFKRLIEEKMHHAEEVMDIFEDLMHQKEMHIASLEFQVQAYRYKLLGMGLTESDIGDSEFEESMLLPPNPNQDDDVNLKTTSSPPNRSSYDTVLHRDDLPQLTLRRIKSWGSSSSSSSSSSKQDQLNKPKAAAVNKSCDQECSDLTSYMELIKELDQRVEGLSTCATTQNDSRRRRRRRRQLSSPSPSPSPSPPQQSLLLQQFDNPPIETESLPSTSNSTRIHDIFEVPPQPQPQPPQGKKLLVLEEDNRLGKPDESVPPHPHGPTAAACIKTSLHHQFINNLPICVNCHFPLSNAGGGGGLFHSQFQHLNKRLEKLEGERRDVDHHHHHIHEDKEDEMLKLLKEIHEQLNTIKSEITIPPVAQPQPQEPCLVSLMEAMFFYSL